MQPAASSRERSGIAARLVAVLLDEPSLPPCDDSQAHERAAAIHDLVDENRFAPIGPAGAPHEGGPYALTLSMRGGQLALDVRTEAGEPVVGHLISLTPLRASLRDYRLLCDSFGDAVRSSKISAIETLDMTRRSLHDQAGAMLVDRLAGKIAIDLQTGRRLFSLIDALAGRR